MLQKRTTKPKGFTLVELMLATVIAPIVLIGIAIVLADSHRGWNSMYDRTYSNVVTDSYVARKMFDAVIRNASRKKGYLLDDYGNWVEAYYYADANSTDVDRYARFSSADGQLNIEHGILDSEEIPTVQTVCENVQRCVFQVAGQSVQMILTLDNGSERITVVSLAAMHNE